MATTTNYGWTTPNDTDLVKDGASAIRTLGSAIDSTVFTNAGNAINKSIVDAKGDLIAATAADTVARLAVGTNGEVLTADSTTSTGLKWATAASGSLTELATGSLSSTFVSITGLSTNYKSLLLVINGAYLTSGTGVMTVRLNTESSTAYNCSGIAGTLTLYSGIRFKQSTDVLGSSSTGGFNAWVTVNNYTSTNSYKHGTASWSSGSDSDLVTWAGVGILRTTAITGFEIVTFSSTFAGGTYTIYGAN